MDKIRPFVKMTKVSVRFFAMSLMRIGVMLTTLVWIFATNTIVHGDEMERAIAGGIWMTSGIYLLTELLIMFIIGADIERVEKIVNQRNDHEINGQESGSE